MSIQQKVKELREKTGAGVVECARALEAAGGDVEAALKLLAEKAAARAQEKEGREVRHGLIHAYVHGDGRIGVLIEVRCESDFLSRSEQFRNLVKELALQVAATAPTYVSAADVPAEEIERVREEAKAWAASQGKPEQVVKAIADGKVRQYLTKACLLEQEYVRDPKVRVAELVSSLAASSGEKIEVAAFTRYELPAPPVNPHAVALAQSL